MRWNNSLWLGAFSAAIAVFLTLQVSWAQTLIWLYATGSGANEAFGVSDDGRIVVGRHRGVAAVWRLPENTLETCSFCSTVGWLSEVSPSGNLAVGTTAGYPSSRPLIWTPSEGFRRIEPTNTTAWLYFVTPTGNHAAGYISPYLARWDLAQGTYKVYNVRGYANGISDDGLTICGGGYDPAVGWSSPAVLIRLDSQGNPTQMIQLRPASGYAFSHTRDMEGDGSVVVGVSSNGWDLTPTMWRAATNWQPELLPHLGGNAFPHRLRNGILYGYSDSPQGRRAVRWNLATRTIEDLNATYAFLLTDGSVLRTAWGVSRNGRYVVGYGYNAATRREDAFLLILPCTNGDVDENGCVDDADLLAVLFAFGNTGSDLGHVDVNCDNTVDDADLLIVLFNFGSGC